MPRCFGASGSVRARQIAQSASRPARSTPSGRCSRQPPSTRSALVRSEARSEPASGSLNSWHQVISPRSVGPTKRSRCSSVPCARMVGAAQAPITRSGRVTPAPAQLLVDQQLLAGESRRGRTASASAARASPVSASRTRCFVAGAARRSPRPANGVRTGLRSDTGAHLPACARPARARRPRRATGGAAEQLPHRQRAAQVQVRVVLPGEADAAEHLDAVLGVVDRGVQRDRTGDGRRERRAAAASRRPRAPRPRRSAALARPGTACPRTGV